jgi:hypothetical protein
MTSMRGITGALIRVSCVGIVGACTGNLANDGTGVGRPGAPVQSPADASVAVDAATGDSSSTTTFPKPPQCSNPGPFATPTSATLVSGLVGTWIDCNNSIFAGAGVPIDEVAVVIRPDGTWEKLGVSGGQLVSLTQHTDHGTWAAQPPSMYPGVVLTWDTSSLSVNPTFSADGSSMQITTSAGGNQAILARPAATSGGAACDGGISTMGIDGGSNPACEACLQSQCSSARCACLGDTNPYLTNSLDGSTTPACPVYVACVVNGYPWLLTSLDAGRTAAENAAEERCAGGFLVGSISAGDAVFQCALASCSSCFQ